MISVAEALSALFALVKPLDVEDVPLTHAGGRVLRADVVATRDQPPFAASSMDGYAVQAGDVAPGAILTVIGEAAAGHRFSGALRAGEAVRIFTGAPVPDGATRVVIQEDTERTGDRIRLRDNLDPATYIRPAGMDFTEGDRITAPRRLAPADLALAAAMNVSMLTVARRPRVCLLATGDELVMPGESPGENQIVASNIFGLKAMLAGAGADVSILPIARDTLPSLAAALDLAEGCDLLVTIGGASVGDHDLVAAATQSAGMQRAFYKVAMRPGKPLMAGRIAGTAMVGLPGNPVSALVCGEVFLRPVLDVLLGLPGQPRALVDLALSAPIGKNGPREHYMRARRDSDGVAVLPRQDSALLSVLSQANALVVRAPHDPARAKGDRVRAILLD